MSGKSASTRMPAQRIKTTLGWRRKPEQMDLFGSPQASGVIGAPAWLELPAETQRTLTALMTQLILEHADKSPSGGVTEAGYDF
jgi:hypothetical protein